MPRKLKPKKELPYVPRYVRLKDFPTESMDSDFFVYAKISEWVYVIGDLEAEKSVCMPMTVPIDFPGLIDITEEVEAKLKVDADKGQDLVS